jgi:periplasmic copper chaperone A
VRAGQLLRLVAATVIAMAVISVATIASCSGDDDNAAVAPKLTISDQYVATTNNDVAALYLTIKNAGGPDTLLSVRTDVSPTAMIHEEVVQGFSSTMKQLATLPIPAHGEVSLKPGVMHIMIMDVPKPLREGDSVRVTLTFEQSGTMNVTAPVKPIQ